MSKLPDPVETASAPMRGAARSSFLVVGLSALSAALSAPGGLWWATALIGFSGVMSLVSGIHQRGTAIALAALDLAAYEIAQGRIADAERLIARAEAASSAAYTRRAALVLRATIAWRSGDLGTLVAHADAAVERPLGLFSRFEDGDVRASAQALRALGKASLGDVDGARQDIAAVRASAHADPVAVARAEIAEAIALSRTGERAALRQHLVERRALLLERATMRDRAVVRALQRMLAAPKTTVYREAAPHDRSGAHDQGSTLADWLSAVVPNAARFAHTGPTDGDPDAAAIARLDPAAPRPAGGPRAQRSRVWSRLGRMWPWALAFIAAPVLYIALAFQAGATSSPVLHKLLFAAAVLPVPIVMLAMIARAERARRKLAGASSALLRGDPEVLAAFPAMTRSATGHVAAQAELVLAEHAERRADFAAARAACDDGIEAADRDKASRIATSQRILPGLRALRAFLLAATDRPAEARAELALLAERHPTYPHRAAAELRVALVTHLRRGDLAAAASLAAGPIEDLTLSLRDETLLDMVRVVARPGTAAAERERIQAELRDDPELARWVDLVAPALVSAFAKPRAAAGEGDAKAEEEAAAVEEEEEAVAERARG